MEQPEVSIILPVYNAEQFLDEAIRSLLKQTLVDFELIAINDQSTDGSLAVLQKWQAQDARIKIYQNELQKGIVGALNTGLQKALGQYIARADGDDIQRPERLQKQVLFLEKYPEIMLVGGGYAPFRADGYRREIFHPTGCLEIAWNFISDTFFCHPSVMFRREILTEIGNYPETIAEDFAYFSQIVRKYRTANLKEILVDYREHSQNLSVQKKAAIAESVYQTFLENYQFYLGTLENAEKFFQFQSKRKLELRDFGKNLNISLKILKKIRKQYQIPILSTEYLQAYFKILYQCIKTLKQNLLMGLVKICR